MSPFELFGWAVYGFIGHRLGLAFSGFFSICFSDNISNKFLYCVAALISCTIWLLAVLFWPFLIVGGILLFLLLIFVAGVFAWLGLGR